MNKSDNFDTISIPKTEFNRIEDKLKEMEFDGEWLPKMAISKLCIILHYFKKSETEMIEQAIHRKAKSIVYDSSERAYLIKILISLGLIKKTKNYRSGYNQNLYIYTGEYGFYSPNGELLENMKKMITRSKMKKQKRDDKYNYLVGLRVNADDLISHDMNKAIESGDSEEIENIKRQIKIVSEINEGIYKVSRKESGERRLYSNVTFLKSDYRKTMNFNGTQLVEVDIRACHPSILPMVLEDFAQNREYDYLEMKAKGKNVGKMRIWDLEKLRNEISEYINYLESGIYEEIADFISISREDAKDQLIKFINDTNARIHYQNIHLWFNSRFPIMTDIIDHLHSIEARGKVKKDGKNVRDANSFRRSLCFMCMRTEARVILENVILKFRENNPKSLIASVHDALIVEIGKESEIEDLIIERFREIGIVVKTKQIWYKDATDSEETPESPKSFQRDYSNYNNLIESRETQQLLSLSVSHTMLSKTESVPVQKDGRSGVAHDRASKISTTADGRFMISIKDRKFKSRKNETLEDFETRIKTLLIP